MAETIWEERNRIPVLLACGTTVAVIAIVERLTKANVPAGLLCALPIMLAAGFLPRWMVAWLALVCAVLSSLRSSLDVSFSGLALEFLALAGCGLFAGEWIRNRRFIQEARENLRVLVETSPAAIFTVDERGLIDFVNRAASDLVRAPSARLVGRRISGFFPELHDSLRRTEAPRTGRLCRGFRGNGQSFITRAYCSSYQEGPSAKLAVIIGEATEETAAAGSSPNSGGPNTPAGLSGRETAVLGLMVQGLANKQIAARMDTSESKVKQTMQRLFAKCGVRTRAQLVKVALENYGDLVSEAAPKTSPVRIFHRRDWETVRTV